MLRAADGPLEIAEIAERLGVHPNTARFHLETLVRNGQAERAPSERSGPGRPAQLFRAVPGMDPGGPRHYRVLAEVLATGLSADPDASRKAVDAGRLWGSRHAAETSEGPSYAGGALRPVEQLVRMLDELGFAPERSGDDAAEIGLRHCPFLELAVTRADVVCPIHLGLMQGAMESWESPVSVDRLDAFVEPDLCVAHLSAGGASS